MKPRLSRASASYYARVTLKSDKNDFHFPNVASRFARNLSKLAFPPPPKDRNAFFFPFQSVNEFGEEKCKVVRVVSNLRLFFFKRFKSVRKRWCRLSIYIIYGDAPSLQSSIHYKHFVSVGTHSNSGFMLF